MHGSAAVVPGDLGLGTWHSAVPEAAPSRGLSEAVLHPCILPITVSARVPLLEQLRCPHPCTGHRQRAHRRVPQVSAFGFMTPGYRAYSDHYFDRGHKEVQFYVNHDLKLEMRLWQRLQRSGLLRLYTGTEGT